MNRSNFEGFSVTNPNVFLLDDDPNNVKGAIVQGYKGCVVTENFTLQKLLDHVMKIPLTTKPK